MCQNRHTERDIHFTLANVTAGRGACYNRGAMNTTYMILLGILALLAVFDLVVGVSNDAANFLNSALGCRAGRRRTVLAFAAVGVLVGASFSGGMMEIARSGVFNPALFSYHDIMLLFLAVMLTDVLLLDAFNTLGLPTSTTVSLVFELLGAGLAVAVTCIASGTGASAELADYINSAKALGIISGIFCSVAVAFTCGAVVMWFSRLIFSFRYARSYRYLGALWCACSLTAITWFTLFKGMKHSVLVSPDTLAYLSDKLPLATACVFAGWFVICFVAQHLLHLNTLRFAVLCGTAALAFAFAGNDLVNFIGVFMAAETAFRTAAETVAAGGDLATLRMGALAEPVQANALYLTAAGLIMVLALCFSRKAQHVTETEIKLSRGKKGSKERFGSSLPARLLVRHFLSVYELVRAAVPARVARFVSSRFAPADIEETASYDLIRGSVNLTVAALLISLATSLKLPLSTTYVTFMVAMGSALADRAWGRESAVYRITGVLTVIGGWFMTAIAACTAAFLVATLMMHGGIAAVATLVVFAGFVLVKSARRKTNEQQTYAPLQIDNPEDMRAYTEMAAARLDRMLTLHREGISALLKEDAETLRALRKESRKLRRELEDERDERVIPALQVLSPELASRGQMIFAIQSAALAISVCLLSQMKAGYRHLADYQGGLSREQGEELSALTAQLRGVVNQFLSGTDTQAHELNAHFTEILTRHFMQQNESESDLRNSLLFLTLLNETRAMVTHALKLRTSLAQLKSASELGHS